MTAQWAERVHTLTGQIRQHTTDPNLDVIAHPQDHPCPPCCPKCHLRHRGPCPCVICHTTHKRQCPDQGRPRPGCLTCQLSDDLARAEQTADLGDGLRSPSLEPSGGGGGPTSRRRPTPVSRERWWTAPAATDEVDDETGGSSTSVESSALRPHPDRGHLARCLTHRDEAMAYLGTALRDAIAGRNDR